MPHNARARGRRTGSARLRPEIRVVFMSGYDHSMLGATDTLTEDVALLETPFREPALLDAVREALDHHDDRSSP